MKLTHELDLSSEFPFPKRRISVLDSSMTTVDVGDGPPVLLVHGSPTSSYLWRNVIPHVLGHRVLAVDLIGMGDSEKPDIPYRFEDHLRYFDAFLDALDLRDLVLVLHDWGGGLGLDWAMRHPDRVRGVALLEAVVRPGESPPAGDEPSLVQILRSPAGDEMLMEHNLFVEELLPAFAGRQLSSSEMTAYRAPFLDVGSRAPIRRWIQELPLDGQPADNHARMSATWAAFCASDLATLVLTAKPGAIFDAPMVNTLREELPRADFESVGEGLHYLQETTPRAIGRELAGWLSRL